MNVVHVGNIVKDFKEVGKKNSRQQWRGML